MAITIGIIGLGNLGRPIATRITQGGNDDVVVYDLSEQTVATLTQAGARAAGSIADVARVADVLITVLPDAPDVEAVALGPDGLADALRPGSIYVDMSTIDPMTVRRVGETLSERSVAMLDSPVTRSVDQAWAGQSALLVGGDAEALADVEPLMRRFASEITHCGPLGAGSAMKLVNNYLAAGMLAVITEALGLGIKSGLTLEGIIAATSKSGTRNRLMTDVLPSRAFSGDFTAGFKCVLAQKDQRLALELARAVGVETPMGDVVAKQLGQAAALHPDEDFTSLLQIAEERSGFKARLAEG